MLATLAPVLSGAGAPPNSYYSIATQTVGSGGASSVVFTSIPSTYTHLQIRSFVLMSSGGGITANFNSDTGANYSFHQLYGDGSSVSVNAGAVTQTFNYLGYAPNSGSYPMSIVSDILDYKNTNKNKTLRSLAGQDSNGSGFIEFFSGGWYNTSAISTITISGSFAQYSSFALYGVN
jgi:hypothetical protein